MLFFPQTYMLCVPNKACCYINVLLHCNWLYHPLLHLTSTDPQQGGESKAKENDGNESDSSTVSTTSSSGVTTDGDPTRNWETFDEDDKTTDARPPLPPPRSELDNLQPSTSRNPFRRSDSETDEKSAPSRPKSPFEDFSSSIAQTLFDNSQKLTGDDPHAASTYANMSKDLLKTIEEEKESTGADDDVVFVSTAPLVPTTTTSAASVVTSNEETTIVRGSRLQNHRASPIQQSSSSPDLLQMDPQPLQPVVLQNPSAPNYYAGPFSNSSPSFPLVRRPAGPRSPKFAQQLDQFSQNQQAQIVANSSPRTWRQNHSAVRPPPFKPPPYTGGGVSMYANRQQMQSQQLQAFYSNPPLHSQTNNNNSSVGDNSPQINGVYNGERHDSLTRLMMQRLPSLGEFDPLKDYLKEEDHAS